MTDPIHEHHLGVYALILDDAGTHILLIRKAIGGYTGLLDLPGGSLEPGELLEDALRREVQEETGMQSLTICQMGAADVLWPFTRADDAAALLRHIGILYLVEASGTPMQGPDGFDSLGCEWVAIDEIDPQQVVPFVISALEMWRKGQGA